MKKGVPAEAILHYTHAIKLEPSNHLLYSNRSYAFLKLDQYYLALEDANQTIKLQPSWPKGFYRKGEVEFAACQYSMALMSYRQALLLDPTDESIQSAISKTNKEIIREKREAARRPIVFTAGGVGVGLLVVLADQLLTQKPSLQSIFVQGLLVSAFALIGFGMFKAYRYMITSQRSSLLDPPIDLLGEMGARTKNEEDHSQSGSNSTKKGGSSAAKRRYRMGKS
ncbi:protein STIP1 homolog isoform X2 [Pomacea canaliculata]|nr:protein STIP1 homolog isoform X2 [Pomacea canaliculata]